MNTEQKVIFELLLELDEICKKNDITYYLLGGTALGAVRHHAFLPWDDDADIVMDYENYQKFVKVMRTQPLPANRSYADRMIKPYTHTNCFGRYSNLDTARVYANGIVSGMDLGEKIDVFFLLPCPDEGPERAEFEKRYLAWAEFSHEMARNKKSSSEDYEKYNKMAQTFGRSFVARWLFKRMHLNRYKNSNTYLLSYAKEFFYFPKEQFGTPRFFELEGHQLPVPGLYGDHFRSRFGDDWRIVPDQDEQIVHGVHFDPDHSFREYEADYGRYVTEGTRQLYRDLKLASLKHWEVNNPFKAEQAATRAALLERSFALKSEAWLSAMEEIVAAGRPEDAAEVVAPYLNEQLSSLMRQTKTRVPLDPRVLRLACRSLILSGRAGKARKLLAFCADVDEDGSLASHLDRQTYLLHRIELEEDADRTLELAEELLGDYPQDKTARFVKALLLLDRAGSDEESASQVEKLCGYYPEDGDFIRLLADLDRIQGRAEQARGRYESARELTRNGITWLAIDEGLSKLEEVR